MVDQFYVYELALREIIDLSSKIMNRSNNAKNSNSCLANCFPITNIILIPVEGQVSLAKKKTL